MPLNVLINLQHYAQTNTAMQFIRSPDEVLNWLESISMSEHMKSFQAAGYLDLQAILMLEDIDLLAMGIDNPAHRLVLNTAIQRLRSPNVRSYRFILLSYLNLPLVGCIYRKKRRYVSSNQA